MDGERMKRVDLLRNLARRRNCGSRLCRNPAHHLPAVQPAPPQEARSMSQRDVQARRSGLALLALWMEGGRLS